MVVFDASILLFVLDEDATAVYSDEGEVCDYFREAGMDAYRLADLPEPPEDPQRELPLDDKAKPGERQ